MRLLVPSLIASVVIQVGQVGQVGQAGQLGQPGQIGQLGPRRAEAEESRPTFGPYDIATLFFISKSDDRNRVDYGMRLDQSCTPSEKEAVFPYWREFENSPPVRTHPLKLIEYYPYGVATQRMISQSSTGSEYYVRLKRIHRDLYVRTSKGADGRCTATVRTTIAGQDSSELLSAYVKLRRPLSVEYVEIHGKSPQSGQPIDERVVQ